MFGFDLFLFFVSKASCECVHLTFAVRNMITDIMIQIFSHRQAWYLVNMMVIGTMLMDITDACIT